MLHLNFDYGMMPQKIYHSHWNAQVWQKSGPEADESTARGWSRTWLKVSEAVPRWQEGSNFICRWKEDWNHGWFTSNDKVQYNRVLKDQEKKSRTSGLLRPYEGRCWWGGSCCCWRGLKPNDGDWMLTFVFRKLWERMLLPFSTK